MLPLAVNPAASATPFCLNVSSVGVTPTPLRIIFQATVVSFSLPVNSIRIGLMESSSDKGHSLCSSARSLLSCSVSAPFSSVTFLSIAVCKALSASLRALASSEMAVPLACASASMAAVLAVVSAASASSLALASAAIALVRASASASIALVMAVVLARTSSAIAFSRSAISFARASLSSLSPLVRAVTSASIAFFKASSAATRVETSFSRDSLSSVSLASSRTGSPPFCPVAFHSPPHARYMSAGRVSPTKANQPFSGLG